MRRTLLVALLLTLVCALPAHFDSLEADGPTNVLVTNFPDPQRIKGSVIVTEPIPHTRFETVRALVTPAAPTETTLYTDAGTIETAGFASIDVGIAGTVQGRFAAPSPIGVILLPDMPEILAALRTHSVTQFPLRVEALAVSSVSGLFQSEQVHFHLGFPRYRVYLYNATPRTSEVSVYLYLKSA